MNAKQFNKHMSEFLLSDPIFDGVPKFSIGLTSDDSTQTVIPLKDLPELFLTLPQNIQLTIKIIGLDTTFTIEKKRHMI